MPAPLNQQIQQFYDTATPLWERIWGEHMHHGYYGRNGRRQLPHRQAQIATIEELLAWAAVTPQREPPQAILDVGCGVGGATLELARRFEASATGITLSPVQAQRAQQRAQAAGLSQRARFRVADALQLPFADCQFDLVWSLESGEHMPDKTQFLRECYRVLRPGGRLVMAVWCCRPTDSLAGELTQQERDRLAAIYRVYCLPPLISLLAYEAIARECGFRELRSDDWSRAVAPFWRAVIASALTPAALAGLLQSGRSTVQAALAMGLMQQGYARGTLRFGLLCARR